MSDTSSYSERRNLSARFQWNHRAAMLASLEPRDRAAHVIARPYLLVHPEREIAEVRYVGSAPLAWCSACEGFLYPVGLRLATWAYRDVHEHNALVHPRRAARLTQ